MDQTEFAFETELSVLRIKDASQPASHDDTGWLALPQPGQPSDRILIPAEDVFHIVGQPLNSFDAIGP